MSEAIIKLNLKKEFDTMTGTVKLKIVGGFATATKPDFRVTGQFNPVSLARCSVTRLLLPPALLFGTAVNNIAMAQVANIPSPSKAHVQIERSRVTSGARDFENVEQFGHRYLNRADSEKSPRLNPKRTVHSGCNSVSLPDRKNLGRRVKSGCCGRMLNRRSIGTLRCCFVSVSLPSDRGEETAERRIQ